MAEVFARYNYRQVFRHYSTREYQIPTSHIQAYGSVPVIDQGQSLIAGYTSDETRKFIVPHGGVIVFGDHTRIVKYVDYDFCIGADGTQVLSCLPIADALFMSYYLDAMNIPNMGYSRHFKFVKGATYLLPALPEQKRIAQALGDMDKLIDNLGRRIAKKKLIKKGAMQELLTGEKRLPGFNGEWITRKIGRILTIGHGRDYKGLKMGDVPVYGTGGYMCSVDAYLYNGPTVCIGRKGTIDSPMYFEGKIWTVDTLFYTHSFVDAIPRFVYYKFLMVDWLGYNAASGVPSLTAKTIEDIELAMPPTIDEQCAISKLLATMDTEIENLEKQQAKLKLVKKGMLQDLLTGKVRI